MLLQSILKKYSFTPDDFKFATRSQRNDKHQFTITHLKTKEEILSADKFDKKSVTSTTEGKTIISTYLARNIEKIQLKADVVVDIDSELYISTSVNGETDQQYTTPIQAKFSTALGFESVKKLTHIQQRKGEAEMSQIDWLIEYVQHSAAPTSFASIVTSGDIDSVVLHLFALSHLWPRNDDQNRFPNDVYVILQKPGGKIDIFNITKMLQVLEKGWNDRHIGMKLALCLSLGGNDYLPKFYGISHANTLDMFLKHKFFRDGLFKIHESENTVSFDVIMYKQFMKYMYSPRTIDPALFSYQEVRQISIKVPTLKTEQPIRNPQAWMPPETAVEQLAKNVECLIRYYLTAGQSWAPMPNFLQEGCLKKLQSGEIEYDLGPDAYISDISECLVYGDVHLLSKMRPQKRKPTATPQKGRRRKRKNLTSTPNKKAERRESSPTF